MPATAERLAAALLELPLTIEEVQCRTASVAVPGYPGGERPTAVVTLADGELRGSGEHVGFTVREHAAFRDSVIPLVPRGRLRLREFAATLLTCTTSAYDRAALEAAAIDLALKQARTSCARLIGGGVPRAVRYVLSTGPLADPRAAMAAAGDLELKLDVAPEWDDATLAALAESGRVAVLDWKGGGRREEHERLHTALPDAFMEDPAPEAGPWSPSFSARRSADATVTRAADVDADALPAAVSLKPARMGGVLELLAAAAACARRDIGVYLGGMWEVGPGRQQLRVLASLLAPDGPNDIAPLTHGGPRPPRLRVDAMATGFTGGPAT